MWKPYLRSSGQVLTPVRRKQEKVETCFVCKGQMQTFDCVGRLAFDS